jgi:ubiquinone/menaquinone biosynthesis C-methylase UbiE
MQKDANLAHWEAWAKEYGTELRATTKCVTIKRLEIDALARHLPRSKAVESGLALEIGCGNGVNGFALTALFPKLKYVGADFSPKMVEGAIKTIEGKIRRGEIAEASRMAFGVLDARELSAPFALDTSAIHMAGEALRSEFPVRGFDAVLTNRMLINLASAEEQLLTMTRISEVLKPGGVFLMLENSAKTHEELNRVRSALGLPPRPVASYNIFIEEDRIIERFKGTLQLEYVENVSSIHDLLLYAVLPAAGSGEVEYDTPVMTKLTDALLAVRRAPLSAPSSVGQNVLWVWRKPE